MLFNLLYKSFLIFINPTETFLSMLNKALHNKISDVATNNAIEIKAAVSVGEPKSFQIATPTIKAIKIQNIISSIFIVILPE